MYERLYRLVIKHPNLPKGILELSGDSAKLSHNISFRSSVVEGEGFLGGSVTVYGLPNKIIKVLSVMQLKRFNNLPAESYTIHLMIGCRKRGSSSVIFVTIANGKVLEASSSLPPERAITFRIAPDNLAANYDKDNGIGGVGDEKYIKLKDYIKQCVEIIKKIDSSVSFVMREIPDIVITKRPLIVDEKELCVFLSRMGVLHRERASERESADKDNRQGFWRMLEIGTQRIEDPSSQPPIIIMSEKNGMIGLPRDAREGAVVDHQMQVPIQMGRTIRVESKLASQFNGNYVARTVDYSGEFYGDVWQESLALYLN